MSYKGPLYTHLTYMHPCELCGSSDRDVAGRIKHTENCIRPNIAEVNRTFGYGFHVGQVVVTTCRVEFEGRRVGGEWFNESIDPGTLLEIIEIKPKTTVTSDRMVNEFPHRFDRRDMCFVARLADGSRRECIRENFVTIRQTNRDELSQYLRGLSIRRQEMALIKQAEPLAIRLKNNGIEVKGHDVYVALAKLMFNTNMPDLDQINLAHKLSNNLIWGTKS